MKQSEVSLPQAEELVVRYLSPKEVKPYRNNPKKHSEKQVQQIVNSIKEFRFNNPILIDENNELIAGHGRLLAALHLNLEVIPSIRLTHLTTAQKRAYRIADNKLTENGDWDIDLLQLEFKDLDDPDLNFDLDITGFGNKEFDAIFDIPKPTDDRSNRIPFIAEDVVVSQKGDIWQLGKHRIICGDPLEKSTFEALLKDKRADMVFTTPIYNLKMKEPVCGMGDLQQKEPFFARREMSKSELEHCLKRTFSLLRGFTKDGSLHYVCMDWRHLEEVSIAGHQYSALKDLCIWNKPNSGEGDFYRSKHELVFVFENAAASHVNTRKLGSKRKYRTNVWNYAGLNSFEEKELLKICSSVKPVELVRDAILDGSNQGQIVLDCFLGCGSTLIACEKAKRICFGIEREPLYVDTTICRWEELTDEKAIRVSDGKTYDELTLNKQGDIYESRI